ncbi:MAG: T9SS type A sorting domain-containing protein, partial [Bacteroidota bacterium]
KAELRLYPNPTGEQNLRVAWPGERESVAYWYVYNGHGQEVRRGTLAPSAEDFRVPTKTLPTGVYLFRLRTQQRDWSRYFVR